MLFSGVRFKLGAVAVNRFTAWTQLKSHVDQNPKLQVKPQTSIARYGASSEAVTGLNLSIDVIVKDTEKQVSEMITAEQLI